MGIVLQQAKGETAKEAALSAKAGAPVAAGAAAVAASPADPSVHADAAKKVGNIWQLVQDHSTCGSSRKRPPPPVFILIWMKLQT